MSDKRPVTTADVLVILRVWPRGKLIQSSVYRTEGLILVHVAYSPTCVKKSEDSDTTLAARRGRWHRDWTGNWDSF